jgi:hypothetical protein
MPKCISFQPSPALLTAWMLVSRWSLVMRALYSGASSRQSMTARLAALTYTWGEGGRACEGEGACS